MNKRSKRKMLCVLLACVLAASPAFTAFAGTPAEDAHLHFDMGGRFRILNFSDLQDTDSLDERSQLFIRRAVALAQPDLIVLTGDNIYGTKLSAASKTQTAIASFMDTFEELGVPVAIVFGNHDDEGKARSKEAQMAIYNSYSVSVSYDEGSSMNGCGTYNVPIYGSAETDKVKFNLWMFDTGSNAVSGYDHMRDDQLNWYVSKSNELKEANGGVPVPSIAFQHIVVREIFDALKQVSSGTEGAVEKNGKYYVLPDNAVQGSVLGEGPCPSSGGNEFSVCRSQGDMLAIVCGHDHINQFVIPYQGIDLICTPTAGFYSYGNAETRGARVIDLYEQSGTYSTYMINLKGSLLPEYHQQRNFTKYVKDIAVCYARSAQYGSRENAIAHAYERVAAAVDAANGNGVAMRTDLNGGNTADSSSGDHYAICMGYTLTDDPNEAMRGLGLFYASSGDAATKYNGSTINGKVWYASGSGSHAVSGADGAVDLNIGTSGDAFYFYATYDSSAGDPLTGISAVNTGTSAILMSDHPGFNLAYSIVGQKTGSSYGDLNKTAKGDYVYALYRASTDGITKTQIDTTELRAVCYEAAKTLKAYETVYSLESRQALYDVVRQTRDGILRDLDADRLTSIYTQQAIDSRTQLLRQRLSELSRGKVTVTFVPNGGVCDTSVCSFEIGSPIGTMPSATRSRYVLTGWFTQPEGGERIDENTVLTSPSTETWYAHWTLDGFWIAGDADMNDVRDLRDVTLIVRYLVGGYDAHPDFDHADVNWDGVVNLRDAVLLRRYIADWAVDIY